LTKYLYNLCVSSIGDMTEESEKQVRITYETLYELLRREKSNDELQKLDESFFRDVIEYLAERTKYSRMLQESLTCSLLMKR